MSGSVAATLSRGVIVACAATLLVACGTPQSVTIPDSSGEAADDVVKGLEADGVNVKVRWLDVPRAGQHKAVREMLSERLSSYRVCESEPSAGQVVDEGSDVVVQVGRPGTCGDAPTPAKELASVDLAERIAEEEELLKVETLVLSSTLSLLLDEWKSDDETRQRIDDARSEVRAYRDGLGSYIADVSVLLPRLKPISSWPDHQIHKGVGIHFEYLRDVSTDLERLLAKFEANLDKPVSGQSLDDGERLVEDIEDRARKADDAPHEISMWLATEWERIERIP